MDEVQEAAIVEANLDALPSSPTAEQILQAIKGYGQNAINIAMGRTSAAPGGTPVTVVTQAEYDALAPPDPDTLYVIVG